MWEEFFLVQWHLMVFAEGRFLIRSADAVTSLQ